jgi:uncharacterized protein YndB with AHSA1/START domain
LKADKEVMFLVRIEKSIEIKASPEKVWEMLAFDKAVEWMEECRVHFRGSLS